jgi:hypothetical protein
MNFRKTTLTLASRFFTPQNLEEMVEKYSKSGISQYIGVEKTLELHRKKWKFAEKCLNENPPGFNHEDWALYNAAFSVQYNFSFDFYELTDKSAFVNVYERYELNPWKGSRLEASKKIEKAAIALGARDEVCDRDFHQVGSRRGSAERYGSGGYGQSDLFIPRKFYDSGPEEFY